MVPCPANARVLLEDLPDISEGLEQEEVAYNIVLVIEPTLDGDSERQTANARPNDYDAGTGIVQWR